jgi:hypothetical protein
MTPRQIVGWKNYAVAALCIIVGLWALKRGNIADALKALFVGLAIISLRDVLGKVLTAVDSNCEKLDNLRAAIEADLKRRVDM